MQRKKNELGFCTGQAHQLYKHVVALLFPDCHEYFLYFLVYPLSTSKQMLLQNSEDRRGCQEVSKHHNFWSGSIVTKPPS